MELILGAIAGALAQVFTIPVAVIATRQQLAEDPSPSDAEKALGKTNVPKRDNSFIGVAREIIDEDGVTGLWTGLKPGLVLTVNPAITYGVFERLKSALVSQGKGMSPLMAFALGALSKTLATVVCDSFDDCRCDQTHEASTGDLPIHYGQSPAASPIQQ